MSLPNEASWTADFNMAVQIGDVFKPINLFCLGNPPRGLAISLLSPSRV
jgi:hypothetical protein